MGSIQSGVVKITIRTSSKYYTPYIISDMFMVPYSFFKYDASTTKDKKELYW